MEFRRWFAEWILAPLFAGVIFLAMSAFVFGLWYLACRGVMSIVTKYLEKRDPPPILDVAVRWALALFALWMFGVLAFAVCREVIEFVGIDSRWLRPR
jgi:hypothetical protein